MNINRLTKNKALRTAMTAGTLVHKANLPDEIERVKELISEAESLLGGGKSRDEILLCIAREELFIETFEVQGRDHLDFREVGIQQIKDALDRAYEAGRNSVSFSDKHRIL